MAQSRHQPVAPVAAEAWEEKVARLAIPSEVSRGTEVPGVPGVVRVPPPWDRFSLAVWRVGMTEVEERRWRERCVVCGRTRNNCELPVREGK